MTQCVEFLLKVPLLISECQLESCFTNPRGQEMMTQVLGICHLYVGDLDDVLGYVCACIWVHVRGYHMGLYVPKERFGGFWF